ncbi:MAG: hypothetical protein FWD46_07655 [Cystobacterineae bacterium]|nr:hypothetical protein [Cystobacterineae bacterium]
MVWRRVFWLLLLPSLGFAQASSEACRERCVQAMMGCLSPCANSHSKNSKDASLDCIQACREKYQPCFKACE